MGKYNVVLGYNPPGTSGAKLTRLFVYDTSTNRTVFDFDVETTTTTTISYKPTRNDNAQTLTTTIPISFANMLASIGLPLQGEPSDSNPSSNSFMGYISYQAFSCTYPPEHLGFVWNQETGRYEYDFCTGSFPDDNNWYVFADTQHQEFATSLGPASSGYPSTTNLSPQSGLYYTMNVLDGKLTKVYRKTLGDANVILKNQDSNGVYQTVEIFLNIYRDEGARTGSYVPEVVEQVHIISDSALNFNFRSCASWESYVYRGTEYGEWSRDPNTFTGTDYASFSLSFTGDDPSVVSFNVSSNQSKDCDGTPWSIVSQQTITGTAGDGTTHNIVVQRTALTPLSSDSGDYTIRETFTLNSTSVQNGYTLSRSTNDYVLSIVKKTINIDTSQFSFATKEYDGQGLANCFSNTHSNSFGIPGATLDVSFSPALSSCVNANENGYTITLNFKIVDGNGDEIECCEVAPSSCTKTAIINRKTVNYNCSLLSIQGKTYDGTGLQNNVTNNIPTNVATGVTLQTTYSSSSGGTLASCVDADTYTIRATFSLTGNNASNYKLASPGYCEKTVTISPQEVTIDCSKLTISGKEYDGTSLDGGATNTNTVPSGSGLSLSISYDPALSTCIDANTYNIVATFHLLENGHETSNYVLSQTTCNKQVTITKKRVQCTTCPSIPSKQYDGTGVSLNRGTWTGLGQGVSVKITASPDLSTIKNVSQSGPVTLTYTLEGENASNYELVTPSCSVTATITPVPITISGGSVSDKTYDGTRTRTFDSSGISWSGSFPSGEGISSVTATCTPSQFSNKNAGTTTSFTINYTPVFANGTDSSNYTWTTSSTTSASISKAHLTWNTSNECPYFSSVMTCTMERDYNGAVAGTANFPDVTLTGFVNNEGVTIQKTITYGTPDGRTNKKVGNYSASCVYSIQPNSGTSMSNYEYGSIPTINPAVLTIKSIKVTVTGVSSDSSVACANNNWTFNDDWTISGVLPGDDVTFTPGGTATENNNGESYTLTFGGGLTGSDAGNYEINSFVIPTVTCSDYTSCHYPSLYIRPLGDSFDPNTMYKACSTVETRTINNVSRRCIVVRCVVPYGSAYYPSQIRVLACRKEYNLRDVSIRYLFNSNFNQDVMDSTDYQFALQNTGNNWFSPTGHLLINQAQNKWCMYTTCDTSTNVRGMRYWEAVFPIEEDTTATDIESLNNVGVEIPYKFYAWGLEDVCVASEIVNASFPAIERVVLPPVQEVHNTYLVDTPCNSTVLSDSYTGRGATWDSGTTEHNLYNALYFAQDGDTILFASSLMPQSAISAPIISTDIVYDVDKGVVIDARKPYKVVNNNIVEDTDVANWLGVELTNSSGYAIFDVDIPTNKTLECYNLTFTESGTGFGCQYGISSWSPCYIEGCNFHYFSEYGIFAFDTIIIRRCYFSRNGRTYPDSNTYYNVGGGVWLRLACEVSSCLFLNNANGIRNGRFSHISNNTILFDTTRIGVNDIEQMCDEAFGVYFTEGCHNNFIAGYPIVNTFLGTDYPGYNNIILTTNTTSDINSWNNSDFSAILGTGNSYNNELYRGFGVSGSGCPAISAFLSSNYAPNNEENATYTVINKGNNNFVTTIQDYAGNTRIYGMAVDVGCYEYYPAISLPTLVINDTQTITFDGQAHSVVGIAPVLLSSANLYILDDGFDYTGYDASNSTSANALSSYMRSEKTTAYTSSEIPTITHVNDTDWSEGQFVIISVPGYQSWVGTISASITARPITISNAGVTYIQKQYL